MKKLYDLVIRIPVFQTDDGRICGEAQTTLPSPTPGAPHAVTTTPRTSLAKAVGAVIGFAAANDVTILDDHPTTTPHLEQFRAMLEKYAGDTTTIPQPEPAPAGATMTVGDGGAKEMPAGLAESMLDE